MTPVVKQSNPDASTEIQLQRNIILGKGFRAFVLAGSLADVPVAVKRVFTHDVHPDLMRDGKRMDILKKLHHPNVLKLLDTEEDDDFR